MTTAGAALDGQAIAEASTRTTLDRVRADRATLQLREGRHVSELEAARRERASLEDARVAAAADVASSRQVLALPIAEPATELEAELSGLDAEIAAAGSGAGVDAAMSPTDAAAIRRLEAAHAQELAAARRRASEAEQAAAEELARASTAAQRAADGIDGASRGGGGSGWRGGR